MNRFITICLNNLTRLPGAWRKLCHYAKHRDRYDEKEMFAHISYMMGLAVKGGKVDLQVFGREHIPQENGYMMYGNHQGLFDVIAIPASLPGPLAVVYKKELSNTPVLKQIYQITKSFAMDRDDVRQSLTVIQAVTEEVKNGRNYLIFPEGTRSKNGNQMGAFHGGSFRCAVKAKCPILPFALIDSWKVFEQKNSKPVTVQLHYLPVIPYEEYKDLKTTEIADLIKGRIQAVIDQYSGENDNKTE